MNQRIKGGDRELDRIVFFSDAVFAIAITLLVLSIEVPQIPENLVAEELLDQLFDLGRNMFSYVLSFLVIFSFWTVHHSMFSSIRGYDRGLLWLNGLFLMAVAFLPFPSALLGEYGDQQLVVAIYGGSMAVTRLLLSAVWWYASIGRRLIASDLDPGLIRAHHVRGVVIPLIFLISIGISFFSVRAAIYSWILLAFSNFVGLRMLYRRYQG